MSGRRRTAPRKVSRETRAAGLRAGPHALKLGAMRSRTLSWPAIAALACIAGACSSTRSLDFDYHPPHDAAPFAGRALVLDPVADERAQSAGDPSLLNASAGSDAARIEVEDGEALAAAFQRALEDELAALGFELGGEARGPRLAVAIEEWCVSTLPVTEARWTLDVAVLELDGRTRERSRVTGRSLIRDPLPPDAWFYLSHAQPEIVAQAVQAVVRNNQSIAAALAPSEAGWVEYAGRSVDG